MRHDVLQARYFFGKHVHNLLGFGDVLGATVFRSGNRFQQIFVPFIADAKCRNADAFGLSAASNFNTAAFIAIGAPVGKQNHAADAATQHGTRNFLQAHDHAGRHFGTAFGFNHADGAFNLFFIVGALTWHHHFCAIIERHQREIILPIQLIDDVIASLFDLIQPFAAHRRTPINNKAHIDGNCNIGIRNTRRAGFNQQIDNLRIFGLGDCWTTGCGA